jgi:hypothetical protein
MNRGMLVALVSIICFATTTICAAATWAPIGRVTKATYSSNGRFADVSFTVNHYVIMATFAGSSEMPVSHKTFSFHSSGGGAGHLHLEILHAGQLFMRDYRDGETIRFAVRP